MASTTTSRDFRGASSKRGLRSLSAAVALPALITLLSATSPLSSSSHGRAFWFPPPWVLHVGSISAAALAGLASWLVWAAGGLRREPAALPLHVLQVALGAAWAPVVRGAGAARVGVAVCAAWAVALVGCSRVFGRVNPVAADLVKPCIAWALLLALLSYMLREAA